MEFLRYVENSNDEEAENAKGNLVKHIHDRVKKVKNDDNVEVEFMTLLERDKEKIEEGKEEGKTELLIKLLIKKFKNMPKKYEEKLEKLPPQVIEAIATDIFDLEKIEDLEKYF